MRNLIDRVTGVSRSRNAAARSSRLRNAMQGRASATGGGR